MELPISNKTIDLRTHENFLYDEKTDGFKSLETDEKLMFVDARLSALEKSINDVIVFLNDFIEEENQKND